MVVDFGESATFGAGVVAMSVEPAVSTTDSAWERAVRDALAARDEMADATFQAATFTASAFEQDDFDAANEELAATDEGFDESESHEDLGDIEDDDEEAALDADEAEEEEDSASLAQSQRRAIIDDDERFWAVARAADEARTQLARDPGLADLVQPEQEDAEVEADEELRRDLAELQQQPVEPPNPAAPVAAQSAHSIFDNMTMATTFDVGTVEVTRTFDALDAELDRQERARERMQARASAAPPHPARTLELEDVVEDLAWIQQAIGNGDASPPEPPPSPSDMPVVERDETANEPMNEQTEPERSAS